MIGREADIATALQASAAMGRIIDLVEAEIANFKSVLDGEGNLLHPHFDALEEIMSQVVIEAAAAGRPALAMAAMDTDTRH
jgi:hypothetical protein